MTLISRIQSLTGMVIFGLALAGCDREQVTVQQVPKDSQPPVQLAQPAAMPPMAGDPHAGLNMNMAAAAEPAQLKWTLPEGWSEKPLSEFRAASFDAKGKNGQVADVSVIPLPSTGRESDLVNMWRQQMQLPPVTEADADKQAQTAAIGSDHGKVFDITSEQPVIDGKSRGHMLIATLTRDRTSWFFKMTGEDAAVSEQKPAFLQFLKSVSFESAPAAAMANPHAGMTMPEAAGAPQAVPAENMASASGDLPAGWKEVPPTVMLLKKYVVQGSGDAKAEVSVSMLSGQGGGVMANVARWRGQLNLPPLSEEDWSKQAQTLDLPNGKATVVDMTGTDKTGKKARMIGVIAPQANETWFYKMMGEEQIVGQQKAAFTKFVQTAKFSDVP
jgi:hypothetical protein